jgi:hypothetical protein
MSDSWWCQLDGEHPTAWRDRFNRLREQREAATRAQKQTFSSSIYGPEQQPARIVKSMSSYWNTR